MGLTAVAQDRGLERAQIAHILDRTPGTTLDLLTAVQPFLEGQLKDGPFRTFHKSFTEYLLEDDSNTDYGIDSSEPHASIVYYYWPRKSKLPTDGNWDAYGRRFITTHLAGAGLSEDEDQRHRMAERMVARVSDPVRLAPSSVDLTDLATVARDLASAVATACGDDLVEGLPLVVRSVRAHQTFFRGVLKPSHIFDHAAMGDTDTALDKLALYTAQPAWQKAARLEIAWLAAKTGPQRAKVVLDQVSDQAPFPSPLDTLYARVTYALGGQEIPHLLDLPTPPNEAVMREILDALLGYQVDQSMIQNYHTGLNITLDRGLSEALNRGGDEAPAYQAREDAPIVVSFANHNKQVGDETFQQYLHIQAANHYIFYRNAALWILMGSVLRHPDPDWACMALRQVLELALTGERMRFEENTPLVLLGLRAASEDPGAAEARAELEQSVDTAVVAAQELNEDRRHSDVYGEHKRRLCALALAYRVDPSAAKRVEELLNVALNIPRGFAGFMYKAWITLFETLQICSWPQPATLTQCLDEAFQTAHKIQDPGFCVLGVARMRMMHYNWPATGSAEYDIETLVKQFARNPLAPKFAPVHVIDYDYPPRYLGSAKRMDLPKSMTMACTLRQISEQLGLSLEGLLVVNKDQTMDSDTIIPDKSVRLHDPDFVPLVAQRLSAEVLTAPLGARDKRRLLQMLIPPALPNPTSLDTVLARLLFASETEDFDAVDVPVPNPT